MSGVLLTGGLVALQLGAAAQLGCAGLMPPLATSSGVRRARSHDGTAVATTAVGELGSSISVLVSGQAIVLIIDGDGDGPDAGDCKLTASISGGVLTLTSMQDSTTALSACSGASFGNLYSGTDTSSDYAGAAISSTSIASSLFGPLRIEMVDEQVRPDGLPVHLDDPNDYVEVASLTSGDTLATAQLCRSGSPRVIVHAGGSTFEFLANFTTAGGQTYLRLPIPLLSWELAAMLGTTSALNVYVPVGADHTFTFVVDSQPQQVLVDTDLDALPACRADRGVPAAGLVSLGALLALLLATGVWRAARRH